MAKPHLSLMLLIKGVVMNNSNRFLLLGGLCASLAIGCLSGCSMWEGKQARATGRTIDQYKSDKIISGRVHEALEDTPVYKFPDVHIDTYQGTVQLSGFVHTEEQKRQAEQITRNVPGVNRVIDNLALIPQNPEPTGRAQGYPAAPYTPVNPNYPNPPR